MRMQPPQALHEEEVGALSPREETLALLQRVPQDIMHEEHGLSLINDEVLEIGEVEEEEGRHKVESMNPSLLQNLEVQRRQEMITQSKQRHLKHYTRKILEHLIQEKRLLHS